MGGAGAHASTHNVKHVRARAALLVGGACVVMRII